MRLVMQVVAIVAALAAFPALAQDDGPIPGSNQDPFSQTYDGQPPEKSRPEQEKVEASRCDRSCACGHHDAKKQEPSKA